MLGLALDVVASMIPRVDRLAGRVIQSGYEHRRAATA